ncbi:threonine--tRNA ligase [Streptomyces sp. TG1A-8]|uniref:threonine--tRNA ligase n=1 Tax=Streptomyces sp. TG1A-8 TaxID=3051385 RepID=UPI00265C4DD6|nr:threonine--tRNA ligase [Streptomyces sp. TG1A-8]MDO0925015.1 threonine--tRNA ligase [Streptomyces sp. TG1A-8]
MDEKLKRIRHSAAHIMAQAVRERFAPEGPVHLAIGPATGTGFHYDFELPRSATTEDLGWIEERMRQIIAEGLPFVRRELSEQEARQLFADEPYKIEIIDGIVKGTLDEHGLPAQDNTAPTLTTYRHGDFEDLCAGPHVDRTSDIDPHAIKVTSVAGAYWRGDETRPMLQRISGTAWETAEELDVHMWRLSEAEKRDHRKLGRELDLFMMHRTAPGMPYWLPDGLRVYNRLLGFWREEHDRRDYQEISSPLVNEKSLWETSGHWQHYVDNMFVIPTDEHSTYGVKPMNCPNAMVVFNRRTTSYRDLPIRLSDCDVLHRNERSGTLQGLLRVQAFRQDDAHIFLPEEEIGQEYARIFEIADLFYNTFGLTYRLRLGTRPDGYVGDLATWNRAESVLREVLDHHAGPAGYEVAEKDGAFYGPKIDILMEDALGREWQMGTIQLDFQLPRRFGCTYVDRDGQDRTPVVIHRVIYGSMERFIGILLEHTGGALPPWLAPRQAAIIPVGEDFESHAAELREQLGELGLRAEILHAGRGSIAARAHTARTAKIPYVFVLGRREAESGSLGVRLREGGQIPAQPRVELFERLSTALRRRDISTELAFADLLPAGS